MYPNYQEIADKLEVGKMYTMFKYGEFGFPATAQFKLVKKEVAPYAQYPQSLLLMFVIKGKRKTSGVRLYGNNRVAIWEGLENPNSEMYGAPSVGECGVTVRKSIGSSFSNCYMERALKSVEAKPIVLLERD